MRSLFPPAGKAKQTNFGPLNVPVVGAIVVQGGLVVSEYPARRQEPAVWGLGLVGDLVMILVPTRGVRVVISVL
jgi:hypothetical protein